MREDLKIFLQLYEPLSLLLSHVVFGPGELSCTFFTVPLLLVVILGQSFLMFQALKTVSMMTGFALDIDGLPPAADDLAPYTVSNRVTGAFDLFPPLLILPLFPLNLLITDFASAGLIAIDAIIGQNFLELLKWHVLIRKFGRVAVVADLHLAFLAVFNHAFLHDHLAAMAGTKLIFHRVSVGSHFH